MEKLKKLILFTVIAIIIIIIILVLTIRKKEYIVEEQPTLEEIYESIHVEEVSNPNIYFTVEKCINQYLQYCSTELPTGISIMLRDEVKLTEEERLTRIYNVLDEEYIAENNIVLENVREYVNISEHTLAFYPINMNMLESKSNLMISTYGVYGRLKDTKTGEIVGYTYFVVTFDANNKAFAIKPNINENVKSIDDLVLETGITEINKNKDNEIFYEKIDDETLIKKYINTYKMYALNNPDIAYEYLTEEYRNAKFGDLEAFKQYINENKERILKLTLDKYQKTKEDDYTQYVCIDTDGNWYIFRETAIMQYTLLLDTYTVDIPEFTEKYNQSDNETKMGMNIEKIVSAINNKDSRYLYSKLADGFKNNYFPTEESFQQYMQSNFFEKNTVEYDSVDNEGKNYMFDIILKNANNEEQSISKRIIMQFKEGTDFVFSFNVQ